MADREESSDNGIQAILSAMMRNPVATVEIIGFIGGMYGFYYANANSIADAKATSEQHYKDLSAENTAHYADLTSQIKHLIDGEVATAAKVEQVFARGDLRYDVIKAKLGEHDVDIARIVAGTDFLVKAYERDHNADSDPHDRHGQLEGGSRGYAQVVPLPQALSDLPPALPPHPIK